MTIDRADIIKAQFLKQRAAHGKAAQILFGLARRAFQAHRAGHLFGELAQATIGPRADKAREIMAHRAHRRGDGHVVVVQDHDQA